MNCVTLAAEAQELLSLPDNILIQKAGCLRDKFFGNHIELCAIINIKNGNCPMDCKFCAQSAHARAKSQAYDLLGAGELASRLKLLLAWPIRHIGLVASGLSLHGAEFDRLLDFIGNLPEAERDRICVSLGALTPGQLSALRASGVRRCHHNLETSRNYYPRVCATQSWDSRARTVQNAIDAGFEVCCGGLFGLGETWADRIDFAIKLAELGVKHIPINFLDPRPGTALESAPAPAPDEALRLLALFRHLLPYATLRVCGGRRSALGNRAGEMFRAGANALMTGDYLTTCGDGVEKDTRMILMAGLEIA